MQFWLTGQLWTIQMLDYSSIQIPIVVLIHYQETGSELVNNFYFYFIFRLPGSASNFGEQ